MKLTRKKHNARFKAKVVLAVVRGDRTPAVNEVARIAAMCRSVERNVLLSQAFAHAMARLERGRLVSVAIMHCAALSGRRSSSRSIPRRSDSQLAKI